MKRVSLVLAGLLVPALVQAQLSDPSTRALGMGGAYTTSARGYEAVAWNPAMLAAAGRPSFSIDLPHVNLEFGSNAYGLSDVEKYSRAFLSDADKQTLLGKIKDSTLTIRSLLGVAPFGLSVGPFGLLVSTAGQMNLGVGKDAVRLALYGNAPRTGSSSVFTAKGSNGLAWAATTVAGSFAWPFQIPLGRLAVGATYKYVIGHFVGSATDLGTQVSFNPLFSATEAGQAIYTNYDSNCGKFSPFASGMCGGRAGSGYGVDLGGTLQLAGRSMTLSAVLVNVIGKMTWDQDRLFYSRTVRQNTQLASGTVQDTVLSQVTLQNAAAIGNDTSASKLRSALLANGDFAKLARAGVALRNGDLTLAADAQVRLKQGLDQQPSQQLAVGAEYRVLGVLPLRAGLASDFAGATAISGGVGLSVVGINLDVSAADIFGSTRPGVRVGFGLGLIF
ncbi:MAG TPA: DUF5723 family protein [Gemmatimonadales bacterium]|nr:DUF5723 family protein [Gemmatimonadales bacterium]